MKFFKSSNPTLHYKSNWKLKNIRECKKMGININSLKLEQIQEASKLKEVIDQMATEINGLKKSETHETDEYVYIGKCDDETVDAIIYKFLEDSTDYIVIYLDFGDHKEISMILNHQGCKKIDYDTYKIECSNYRFSNDISHDISKLESVHIEIFGKKYYTRKDVHIEFWYLEE